MDFFVHLNELNTNPHCSLLPIPKGRFAYRDIFACKDKHELSDRMKQLHSDFALTNAKWGMSRGSYISETGAKHCSTEEHCRPLSDQCTELEHGIDRQHQTLASLQAYIRLAEKRVKALHSMIENLRKEKGEKEVQLAALRRQILGAKDNPDVLKTEVKALEKELAAIQEKLADKDAKLSVADKQLDDLRATMDAVKGRTQELQDEARKYTRTIHTKVDSVLKNACRSNVICHPCLSTFEQFCYSSII